MVIKVDTEYSGHRPSSLSFSRVNNTVSNERNLINFYWRLMIMKDKLFGIGTILVGIMGLYGLYKACVEAASWLFVLILGGISKFVPDNGED